MVVSTNCIVTKNNARIFFFQNLSCSNYGIYAAQCLKCKHIYVGQTKNKFSVRWTSHRYFWRSNCEKSQQSDKAALLIHYNTHHKDFFVKNKPDISDCFNVFFLQEPLTFENLDLLESKWIRKLDAEININRTVLPKFL